MSATILYLHGFNSSPRSQKASELRDWLPQLHPGIELIVPELGFDPDQAYSRAADLIQARAGQPLGLIGSSLGGFYATALSQRFDVPAALINPAVRPYDLLWDYLGAQYNPYTDEHYTLTEAHMAALKVLEPESLSAPENLLLLLQTGDETLDYRDALAYYRGVPSWIQPGGDHRFQRLERVVPAMLAFLGMGQAPKVAD
ncbi:YqiA/YcfP family alpha/beta fold hydrolase [Marinobacter xestospongiae]|uniref:YqiA/YcfP family alpha/beta fold hydrolase n=1 Tax=Marinobacter xestospongiae TaxID=994319 RepID=UPI0020062310|nr:YqiA/YcfP family alpha/beta fold hydrolase [Marinobacter xestospongiae]MCK7568289.1 esterase [Marinobacter xestospongiae]